MMMTEQELDDVIRDYMAPICGVDPITVLSYDDLLSGLLERIAEAERERRRLAA